MVLKYARILLEATVLQMTGNARVMACNIIVEPLFDGQPWDSFMVTIVPDLLVRILSRCHYGGVPL